VSVTLSQRLTVLRQNPGMLGQSLRGIEKEGLRVNSKGQLSTHAHPAALGSALTHPRITTDYSEALLELISGTHTRVDDLLTEMAELQTVIACSLSEEMMWNHSMPSNLPAESEIPIAWYGSSNTGMLKHVYRRGLAERYGKTMQCIAGLHYNFSFAEEFWQTIDMPGVSAQEKRSAGYMALIRNFTRYSWLLMYLFGASPAVSKDFLRGRDKGLDQLDADTLYLPYATSLRMSDLGYQNKAQATLKPCYNDLNSFLLSMHKAVTTPWPPYSEIGTHRNGEWIQLNTNVLQIENEFYSSIRPKRATGPCERPITALSERGIQYVEIRCLDIDYKEPTGISSDTAHFMDAFILFCATQDSPYFGDEGFCAESASNFAKTVKYGRQPGLMLKRNGADVSLADWAATLLDQIRDCASVLGDCLSDPAYLAAIPPQQQKVADPESTPSAQLLTSLRQGKMSFQDFVVELSRKQTASLKAKGLSAEQQNIAEAQAKASILEQERIEKADSETFDDYVKQFHEALKAPTFN